MIHPVRVAATPGVESVLYLQEIHRDYRDAPRYVDIRCPSCGDHDSLEAKTMVTHAVLGIYPEGGLDLEAKDDRFVNASDGSAKLYCHKCGMWSSFKQAAVLA